MSTIGSRLRNARQRLELTLDHVAAATKIPRRTLEDIEQDRWCRLPAGILGRGHLRAYAAAVGVDDRPIVDQYERERFGEPGEVLPIVRPPPVEPETYPGRLLLLEVAIIALGVVAYNWRGGAAEPPTPGAPIRLASASRPSPLARTLLPGALLTSDNEATRLRLEIQPSGACWVSATADDQIVIDRLLAQGDRVVATAREELTLRIGDPGTFVYWLNGAAGQPLGVPGKPVTIRITTDNYQTFLVGDSAAT